MEKRDGRDKQQNPQTGQVGREYKDYTRDINVQPPAGTEPKKPKKQG